MEIICQSNPTRLQLLLISYIILFTLIKLLRLLSSSVIFCISRESCDPQKIPSASGHEGQRAKPRPSFLTESMASPQVSETLVIYYIRD